jgi:hypothetical protein
VRRARLSLAVASLACLSTLVLPAVALARVGAVELRLPGGRLLASLDRQSAHYPANGAVLRIGSSTDKHRRVVIRDVSLLAGRIRASSVVVPAKGLSGARVTGLIIDGVPYAGRPNTVVPLAGTGYLVVLQAAVVPGSPVGVTGLRLHFARRLGELPAGAELTIGVAAAARPWARATTGPLGFNVPAVGKGESTLGERAASLALQYLGIPYLWGGANPRVGLDCSGLTMLVYQRLGIHLGHFTGLQWQEGAHVGRQVQPGDLVFFEPTVLGPGHVGIYLGEGRFIQAPHTGDVVKISSLRSANYARAYVGAVRPY